MKKLRKNLSNIKALSTRINQMCKRTCNARRNVSSYVWTHSEPGSKSAGKWHSERANFITKITIANLQNNEIIGKKRSLIGAEITIVDHSRNNDRIIENNNIKNTDRTIKTGARVEESLLQRSPSRKSEI